MSYLYFKYNNKTINVQSQQYGSDSNGNVCSLIFQGTLKIYNDIDTNIGYIQFIDNSIVTESTNNFNDSPQLYNETATYFFGNTSSITYNISFISNNISFPDGLVVPTVISASGEYYNKIDQIAINTYSNGDRDVWITFLD